ncbi:hypothetical protein RvVAT039_04190 [Agrobacterium vitis]|uniref:Pectate lyase superfamily protein domain-containing protein n=2 Tax=Rhizobium/Agrobacterium group TaxID=227290 RepID=B9JYC2_ALLAM|nr:MULTISPECIES: hypothetical protein [Rhizobium/Agrobacterium group]ACM37152.1 hypothetical protein Avi_2983 [Allorhizobium ampelinum S4]MUO29991.1 hypothetical protein [Agrobacterium vitis]MUO42355.1 hypothetical protein [Agrobacterium vitis]MUP10731.1 hypothetical protein [Agrobacterium vitis]BCH63203.1 hypothetical protein RvVAT039_04190 [Agrobacterium vitis]
MTDLGVRSPNVAATGLLDTIIGNRKGSSRLQSMTDLAKQLAGTSPINLLGNQAPLFKTYADLAASALASKISAWVYEDATAANNGIWRWTGTTWEWALPLPYSFLTAEDAGAGTANAVKATTTIPVSEEMFILVELFRATTGEPATISFNDGEALTIKTNRGTDASALASGMVMAGKIFGSTFRLITDEDVAVLVTQAETARDEAVQAKETAESLTIYTAGATGQIARPIVDKLRDILSSSDFATSAQAKAAAGNTKPIIASDGGLYAPAIGGGAFIRADAREIRLCADLDIKNDGTQDAVQALDDAITYSQARNIPVKPDGSFLMSSRYARSGNKSVRILGGGAPISEFIWPDTVVSPGLDLTFTDQIVTAYLQGIRMRTSGKGTGKGVKISQPVLASSLWRGPVIRDLEFVGVDVFSDCWDVLLDLENCWNSSVSGLYGFGRTLTAGETVIGTAGILTKNCTDSKFYDVGLHGFQTGANFGQDAGDDEGIIFTHFTILSSNTGIKYRTPAAEAGCQIAHGHINAYQVGVDLYAKHVGFIKNLDIYKISGSAADFRGIRLENCNGMQIDDITFGNTGASGLFWGVELASGSDHNKIKGLRRHTGASTIDNMVVFSGTSNDNNTIDDIRNAGNPAVAFATDKSNHLSNDFRNIRPAGEEAFAANAATPSVNSAIWGYFTTANTAATTITTFTNWFAGQTWTVLAKDANTTVAHGSTLLLKGAASVTMPNGGMMTFRAFAEGSVVREIWRSF